MRGEEANRTRKEVCDISEAETSCKSSRDEGKRRTYSRVSMEALRFLNTEAQKRKWVEVYCGLSPAVMKEYDRLASCDQKQQIQLDFDPRKQFQSEDSSQAIDNGIENRNTSNPDSDCSADGDDDDSNSILRPAFFVSGEPNFDLGPPQDGLEYLRRVRWEAARIPKVKVVKPEKTKLNIEQSAYMPNIPDIAKCPEHLLPIKQWEDAFLADFSELRLAFSHLDSSGANTSPNLKLASLVSEEESCAELTENLIENVEKIIAKDDEPCECAPDPSIHKSSTDPKHFSIRDENNNSPKLSVISKMDSVARLSMLRRRISMVENTTSLSKNDCMWLFALCVAIDTPLDADTCASLRCLLRKVASFRAEKDQMDDDVIMLNIIATITGKYFGQSG